MCAGGRSRPRLLAAGAGGGGRLERGAGMGEAGGQGGGKAIAALPQEVQGADSQATAGDSGAGARPMATKPKAAINATSKAVRISDVSPMSPSPAETTPGHCGGARRFQQLRGTRVPARAGKCRGSCFMGILCYFALTN